MARIVSPCRLSSAIRSHVSRLGCLQGRGIVKLVLRKCALTPIRKTAKPQSRLSLPHNLHDLPDEWMGVRIHPMIAIAIYHDALTGLQIHLPTNLSASSSRSHTASQLQEQRLGN